MRYLFTLFFLLIILFSTSAFADKKTEEAPLSLLNQPQKKITSLQQPQQVSQPQELRDIYGPLELQKYSPILIYGAIIVALLLLITLLVSLLIKRRKRKTLPSVPPWEKALSALAEAKMLRTSDQPLLYMTRVSLILRNYVESRFAIKSTRQTTQEFLSNLSNFSADPTIKNCKAELQTCLEQCDMAKFAHQIPLQQNMEMVEDAIIGFVKKTRPISGQGENT